MSNLVLSQDADPVEYVDSLIASLEKMEIILSPYGFGAWSPSKIKSLQCPLKFLLKSVLKAFCEVPVDVNDPKYADQFLSSIGTTAHSTLEFMVKGHSFEEAYHKSKALHFDKVTADQWHRVEALGPNIQHFMIRIERFGVENPIQEMHTELKFALDESWKPCSFFSKNAYFRGVIDLPIILKNRDSLVIDHKHGGSAKYGVGHHAQQLRSYAIAAVTHFRDIRGVTPMIHFIQEGEVAKDEYASKDKILNEYTKSVDSAIHGSIDFLKSCGSFKHIRGNYCDYCEFKPICHGGKRGTANLLQPLIEKSKVFFKC